MHESTAACRTCSVLELLLLAAAFALAHTQGPLFYSNQNQYLLHGLAEGGLGELHADWLANTTDPTPLFSLGVSTAYRTFGLWPLQAGYFVLLMGYFLAVWWFVRGIARTPPTRKQRLAFASLFIATHSGIARWLSVDLAGMDYPWYLQAGVAGQYILGPGLQPSAFGVLLVAALAAFAHRKPYLAVAFQSLACLMHSTYLLPAGLLTAGYVVVLMMEGRTRTALWTGLAAIVGIVPTVALTIATFAPSSPEMFAESQRILAFVRIPHHTVVSRWLDLVAGIQVAWIAMGLLLVRPGRMFPVLAMAAGLSVILTAAQWFTKDATFALFFPWRITAILVPAATAIIAWRIVANLPKPLMLLLPLLIVSVLGGIAIAALDLGYAENKAELETLAYVRDHARPGDVYLLPTRYPAVGTGRGIKSATFMPPPRPTSNMIPVDLLRFRLLTGTPIYVDFKSIPYKDTEVLEWRRRMDLTQEWYKDWSREGQHEDLKREGITHILAPKDRPAKAPWLEPIHEDAAYIVYRVR